MQSFPTCLQDAIAATFFQRPRLKAGLEADEFAALQTDLCVPIADARDAQRRPRSPPVLEANQHRLAPAPSRGNAIDRKIAVDHAVVFQHLDPIHLIPPGNLHPELAPAHVGQLLAHRAPIQGELQLDTVAVTA